MGDCESKIYGLLGNKLEMGIENIVTERAHRTWKKNKNRSRPIVVQFSSYKDKINILKKQKKKKISEDFSRERELPSTRKNGKKFLPIGKKI